MSLRELKFWYWLVDHLPNKLVYFCVMHAFSRASTIHPYKHPNEITWLDAVKCLGVE